MFCLITSVAHSLVHSFIHSSFIRPTGSHIQIYSEVQLVVRGQHVICAFSVLTLFVLQAGKTSGPYIETDCWYVNHGESTTLVSTEPTNPSLRCGLGVTTPYPINFTWQWPFSRTVDWVGVNTYPNPHLRVRFVGSMSHFDTVVCRFSHKTQVYRKGWNLFNETLLNMRWLNPTLKLSDTFQQENSHPR